MRTMKEAIRAGMEPNPAPRTVKLPTAREVMATDLVVFRPDQTLGEVIRMLLGKRISGAPVVGEHGELLGVVSEADCLRALASGAYEADPFESGRRIGDLMSTHHVAIEPNQDIYAIAQIFLNHSLRRLPVVDEGKVIGQVSRRDILKAVDDLYGQLETSGDEGRPVVE
jgi:CBS domain-containing protein